MRSNEHSALSWRLVNFDRLAYQVLVASIDRQPGNVHPCIHMYVTDQTPLHMNSVLQHSSYTVLSKLPVLDRQVELNVAGKLRTNIDCWTTSLCNISYNTIGVVEFHHYLATVC